VRECRGGNICKEGGRNITIRVLGTTGILRGIEMKNLKDPLLGEGEKGGVLMRKKRGVDWGWEGVEFRNQSGRKKRTLKEEALDKMATEKTRKKREERGKGGGT